MNETKGIAYFFLGLGVGVAVGMVFAPQSGEETRGMIKQKATDAGDYLSRQGETIKSQASSLVDQGKQLVNQQKDNLASAVEAGKQAYRETVGGPTDRPVGSENNY